MFNNLAAEQARMKMTNECVANQIGISRTTYESKKKSGHFTAFECQKLCALFDCTFEYLFAVDEKTA